MSDQRRPRIVVVGSFMMDLVVKTPRRPAKGETIVGIDFGMFPGGKGFNQAVGAARLGAQVTMVGRLGQDMFGDLFMEALEQEGIDARLVIRDAETGTGIGMPMIDAEGDNSIVIVPRANMKLTAEDVERAAGAIREADVLMLQLEVPTEASLRAAQIAAEGGARVVLNPAPAGPMPDALIAAADIITPNETEAALITGIAVNDAEGLRGAVDGLRRLGSEVVIVTLGSRGVWLAADEGGELVPAFKVDVVDTTAAGDAFCAGLAVGLAEGRSLRDAARFGNGAGGLATTVLGASPSMPRREVLERFLAERA
jgi:ribokinase